MKVALRLLLGLALVVTLAPVAQADPINFTFTSGTFHVERLGNDAGVAEWNWDILDVNGIVGGNLSLALDTPVILPINAYTFTAGPSSYGSPAFAGNAVWSFDLFYGGSLEASVSLTHPFAGQISWSDTFSFLAGQTASVPTQFGTLFVTLQATDPIVNGGGAMSGSVNALFDLDPSLMGSIPDVPEPASMLLLGTGLIGLAGAARRRLRK